MRLDAEWEECVIHWREKKKKEIWESSLKAWESKKVKEVENHEQEQNKAKNEKVTQIMSILKRGKEWLCFLFSAFKFAAECLQYMILVRIPECLRHIILVRIPFLSFTGGKKKNSTHGKLCNKWKIIRLNKINEK